MKSIHITRVIGIIVALLIVTSFPLPASAEKGIIVLMTRKCFVIETNNGYVIVDGWVSAREGDTVIGDFQQYGSTKIYNTNGDDISGYIYIEDYGLSKSRLKNKWNDKYRAKCE